MSFLVSYVHWFIKTWGRFLFRFYFYASVVFLTISAKKEVDIIPNNDENFRSQQRFSVSPEISSALQPSFNTPNAPSTRSIPEPSYEFYTNSKDTTSAKDTPLRTSASFEIWRTSFWIQQDSDFIISNNVHLTYSDPIQKQRLTNTKYLENSPFVHSTPVLPISTGAKTTPELRTVHDLRTKTLLNSNRAKIKKSTKEYSETMIVSELFTDERVSNNEKTSLMLEMTNGVVSPSLFNNNIFNKSILGGLPTLRKDLSEFISLSSSTETPRTSKLKKTSSPTIIMSHTISPLNKKKTQLVVSHPFPSKQSSFMNLLANSYRADRSSHFRVFKSSVIRDIKPTFVVLQERVIKSVTSKETSLIGDKSHKSSFLSKKDSSMETPFTKEDKVLMTKATNKSTGETIQVKPMNVSMTTKTGREETLAAAGPIKTSPQYFIPFKFAYISLKLGTDWSEFCTGKEFIRKEIADLISKKGNSVEFNQIVFFDILGDCRVVFDKKNNFTTFQDGEGRFIQINLFLLNKNGHYDFNLTETCGALLKSGANDVKNTIYDRKVYSIQVEFRTMDERPYTKPLSPGSRRVITVMSVAGVCVLAVIMAIIRHRHKRSSKCEHQEDNSLDCFHTVTNNQQKDFQFSARSFLNQAFDEPDMLSHPVDSTVLTSFSCNYEAMEDEFKSIPMNMSRLDQIPSGAEIKNRHENVIPNPKTRVPLSYIRGEANSNYINANFVRGYGGKPDFYIACQAPLPETVADFWRMIWEQQCKVILMLTLWDEGDIPQCAPYFSENIVKCHRVFGDFQVSLHKRQVEEHYTISIFRLYNLQRNLFREITHLWYKTWAAHGVPEDVNVMLQYLLEARRYMNNNTGPVVVHCSSGTGRTGIVLALDICMREFEECRTVDILRCVSRLRQDRDGAVQTKEQYFFLYEALNEYSCQFVNQ